MKTIVVTLLSFGIIACAASQSAGPAFPERATLPNAKVERIVEVPVDPLRSLTVSATDTFDVKLPKGAKLVRCWFETPQDDPSQRLLDLAVESPFPYSFHHDEETGTRFLYVEARNPAVEFFTVIERFTITRNEVKTALDTASSARLRESHKSAFAQYLKPEGHVIINDEVRRLADDVTRGAEGPIAKSKRIYTAIIDKTEYWKKDTTRYKASGLGSTEYCMKEHTGNCTDFHALFLSMARAQGIPSRFVMGTTLPAEADGKNVDTGYHCWADFFVPGTGWVPVDASNGDVYSDKQEYYFGNLDERRVSFAYGRNLNLAPKQDGERLNFFIKMYCEVDGKRHDGWARALTYKSVTPE